MCRSENGAVAFTSTLPSGTVDDILAQQGFTEALPDYYHKSLDVQWTEEQTERLGDSVADYKPAAVVVRYPNMLLYQGDIFATNKDGDLILSHTLRPFCKPDQPDQQKEALRQGEEGLQKAVAEAALEYSA